jgi:hypothetical protein
VIEHDRDHGIGGAALPFHSAPHSIQGSIHLPGIGPATIQLAKTRGRMLPLAQAEEVRAGADEKAAVRYCWTGVASLAHLICGQLLKLLACLENVHRARYAYLVNPANENMNSPFY